MRAFTIASGLERRHTSSDAEPDLQTHVHIPDAAAAREAADLIERFGDFAADEAASRACRSRELGNVVHYCRWRQIQRFIEHLGSAGPEVTRH